MGGAGAGAGDIVSVSIWRVTGRPKMPLPQYMTAGSAGCDLAAALDAPLELAPGARARVPTGFAMALPAGLEGQVRPRSGLAVKTGLTVLNAPGTIDPDYRGEIQVALINLGDRSVRIEPGDRIAQLVVAPTVRVCWNERTAAGAAHATARGEGGFGHTGLASESSGDRSSGADRPTDEASPDDADDPRQ